MISGRKVYNSSKTVEIENAKKTKSPDLGERIRNTKSLSTKKSEDNIGKHHNLLLRERPKRNMSSLLNFQKLERRRKPFTKKSSKLDLKQIMEKRTEEIEEPYSTERGLIKREEESKESTSTLGKRRLGSLKAIRHYNFTLSEVSIHTHTYTYIHIQYHNR
jgi:hypothetical protein